MFACLNNVSVKNFTGIDSPCEIPEHPEVRTDTVANAPEDAAELILPQLRETRGLDPA
jgi:bifunctional enzyme CysN/CysC